VSSSAPAYEQLADAFEQVADCFRCDLRKLAEDEQVRDVAATLEQVSAAGLGSCRAFEPARLRVAHHTVLAEEPWRRLREGVVPGEFRTHDVTIDNPTTGLSAMPPAVQVPALVERLCRWLSDADALEVNAALLIVHEPKPSRSR
jgi:Fic family protein